MIKDVINHCVEKGYLIPQDGDKNLKMDYRGRRFVFNPLVFFNECLKEYGSVQSFVFGAGGAFAISAGIWLYNSVV